ncbi:MAG: MFS transporter [Bacteroidales bacterium]|nr:MFS transporter [Bacteroidales bacterium]MBQ6822191.1 MFS transporter [Bacteroidales bacterium]MBR0084832.1 MFS transporter [Bacteroidales bacterium]MBR0291774.1 MFS transporter [Bacteroidales bacterium]
MTKTAASKSYTPAIVVMFALFFMIAFVTNLAGSMGVIVTNQFGASKALSQLGSLANFIAYACMGIPAGLILKRKGYKFTSLLAVVIGFVGVGIQFLSGYVESFAVYVAGAFVAGFSMCMLNIVVNPMLNTLGGGGNKGNQLIQWGGSCNSIGGTIAPVFVGWLVGGTIAEASVAKAAPVMIIAMAIFALAFVVIMLTNIPEPHMETAEEKAARLAGKAVKDPYGPLSFRHFVLGAIAIFFYVGIEVGIPNTANVYFSGLDWVGPALTGTMIGAYWFCMLIGRLVGAPIAGKVSSKNMLLVTSAVAILFLICVVFIPESVAIKFGDSQVPLSLIFVMLCGLCTSIMWGSIFNLAAEGLGKYTAPASGIFMTLVCGGGIIPFVQNLIADHVGSIQSYWLLIICLCYLIFYALAGCKNVNKDIPVE